MGQPAATIGSLHICPKTTGTVTHVGANCSINIKEAVLLPLFQHNYVYFIR